MKTFPALLLAGLCSTAAIACDKVEATRVQQAFDEMGAQWSERNGAVALDWGWAWDGATPRQRMGLLQAFAEGDACLAGRVRSISFYRKGKLVGTASPGAGIQLVSQAASAAASDKRPGGAADPSCAH